MRKYFILGIVALIAYKGNSQSSQAPQVADKVVAVVGGQIILASDVQSQYMEYVTAKNVGADTKCHVLEDLLYQKLLVLEAEKDTTITVSDAQVEAEMDKRLNYYINEMGSRQAFEKFYGETTDQFKDQLRGDVKEILLAQQMRSKVTDGITVSPEDVRKYFESISQDSIPPISAQVEVAQITKMPALSDEEKMIAKQKCEEIRQRVLKGESMANLAILYSDDPGSRQNGGLYKDIKRKEFDPEFEKRAFSLNDGDISEVFETQFGYHFLQVVKRHGELVDVRHILIVPQVSDDDLAKAKQIMDSIYVLVTKDSMSFGEAAARFSDDKNSKYSAGVILNPQTGLSKWDMDQIGQIDPTISFTINSLKVGEISQPAFYNQGDGKKGFRIIKLDAMSKPHKANLTDDYQSIQAAALARKQQKVITDWINRKLREGVFVKIDPEYQSCKFRENWLNPQG